MWSSEDYKLCYVSETWAYFTTNELDKQWGDDWNDAPYQCNAGEPYGPCWHNDPKRLAADNRLVFCREKCCLDDWNEDGTPKWEVCKIAFDAPGFSVPADVSDRVSVEYINGGGIAWLHNSEKRISIYAGCNLNDFIERIQMGGGNVYLATTPLRHVFEEHIDPKAIERVEF